MTPPALLPWRTVDLAAYRATPDGRARTQLWPDRGGWCWLVSPPAGGPGERGWADSEEADALRCADRVAREVGWVLLEGAASCPYTSPEHLTDLECLRCAEAADRAGHDG